MPLTPDDLIADRYRVGLRIDSDAEADVYEAEDELLHRRVNLKVFPPGAADESPVDGEHVLDGGLHDGARFFVLAVFEQNDSVDDDATATIAVVEEPQPTMALPRASAAAPNRTWVPIATAIGVAALLLGVIFVALAERNPDTPVEPAVTTTQPTTAAPTSARARTTAPPATDPPTTASPVIEIPTTEVTAPPTTDPPTTEAPLSDA